VSVLTTATRFRSGLSPDFLSRNHAGTFLGIYAKFGESNAVTSSTWITWKDRKRAATFRRSKRQWCCAPEEAPKPPELDPPQLRQNLKRPHLRLILFRNRFDLSFRSPREKPVPTPTPADTTAKSFHRKANRDNPHR
jgi:hypothetical protein